MPSCKSPIRVLPKTMKKILTDNFNTALSYSMKSYLIKLRKFPWTLLVTKDISKNLFFQKTSFQRN